MGLDETFFGADYVKRLIPVAEPALVGNEKAYVNDCLDTNWISSNGKYLSRFESEFADFCGVKHAIACCNGTVALHLALLAAGISEGDEVIIPTLTFVATANAVVYCNAKPVLIDSEPETWNIDPEIIEECITPATKAIIAVHLYGHPADMDTINEIANRYGLLVIEDAAEAHGAQYKGKTAGSLGAMGTFSFYGNKIITTGEGGMVVTDDEEMARKLCLLRGQSMDPARRYWFPEVGYNYRMTNIVAAIGLAQLEKIDWHLQRRRAIAQQYAEHFSTLEFVRMQAELPRIRNAYWMSGFVLSEDAPISRDQLANRLKTSGIETRPFFPPMHQLPMYKNAIQVNNFPVADSLARRGINLPSYANLTEEDIAYIADSVKRILSV
jgi:perosamine synthetase